MKTAAGGLPIRRKNTNVRETQIGDDEIARRTVTDVRHSRKRCEAILGTP